MRSDNKAVAEWISVRAARLRRDEARIARALGRSVNGLKILIVGPGPFLMEPRFFGIRNTVTAVDLDVMPVGLAPRAYLKMLQQNGFGRFAKTVGRKLLGVDRRYARAWMQELGVSQLPEPRLLQGDITKGLSSAYTSDVAACWAVFHCLPDPVIALRNMQALVRPGGVVFIGLHLYTSNSGHHDIRAFTGDVKSLPPWAHLRASTRAEVTPSAWLNRWRLRDWRAVFEQCAPGYEEYLEPYGSHREWGTLLTPTIRAELSEYEDDELFTVDVFFVWRKPLE